MEIIEADQTRISLEKDFLAMKAQKDSRAAEKDEEYSEYEESKSAENQIEIKN